MHDGKGMAQRAYEAFHAARYEATGSGDATPWDRVPRWRRLLWQAAAQVGFDEGWSARMLEIERKNEPPTDGS